MSSVPEDSYFRRYPVVSYFLLTFLVSWSGALAIAAPSLARGQAVPKMSGIVMFPAMLLGPSVSGILMTWITGGKDALRDLVARARRWRLPLRWYAVLLIPPALILIVLFCFTIFASPAFTPNNFYVGILFGVPAGILEEIGWMGFAFPTMQLKSNALAAALVLGLLWGFWHLPVITFLGAATPHGAYWAPFFLAFVFAMTAMRVLIAWLYVNTKSVFLAQLMHVSSTGALVIFSPPVSPKLEAAWYAVYGCALWLVVGMIAVSRGRELRKRESLSAEESGHHL